MVAIVPLSGTKIRLLSGIPWGQNYQETRWFIHKADQRDFFNLQTVVYKRDEAKFQRSGDGADFMAREYIENLRDVNYMIFQNDGDNPKWFYAFVTDLEYENRETTRVHFTIDVLQTYMFDYYFEPSFIEREHGDEWDENGDPIPRYLDEGLDYGDAYENVYVEHIIPKNSIKWIVIVSTTVLHGRDEGNNRPTHIGVPQPLSFYLIPYFQADDAPTFKMRGEKYETATPQDALQTFYEGEQGNSIVSIYITEHPGFDFDIESDGAINMDKTKGGFEDVDMRDGKSIIYVDHIEDFGISTHYVFDNKYSQFKNVTSSKLLMSPYAITVLDDFKGNRLEVQNENINSRELILYWKGSLGTSNKMSWSVAHYNKAADYNDKMLSNEHSAINNEPTDLPIINDSLSAFLQGHRNTLQQQKDSAIRNSIIQGTGGALGTAAGALKPGGGGAAYGISQMANAMSSYQDTIGGIEAKKEDIDNQPAQVSKMGANSHFDYGNGYEGVWVIQKQIKDEYIEILEDYFHMYGYKTHRVKKPNLRTRKHFNYIKTQGAVIKGRINAADLNVIKDIFNGGVTLWHTDDVGNYRLDNEVKT